MYICEMTDQRRDWLWAIGYVILIYVTLEVARFPLAYLRSQGLLKISLSILFSVALLACLFLIQKNHSFSLWRIAALGGIAELYHLAARTVKTPEEQVHFFEYGLVGILFYRALEHHHKNSLKKFLFAFVISSFAGLCDELLQGLMPHRHYDIHDVFLNMISVFLGLATLHITRPSEK